MLFGMRRDKQIELLAVAIEKAVIRLDPGKKYILVIPVEGSDKDREEWSKVIEQRLRGSDTNLVVVFAEWAKMIEFA